MYKSRGIIKIICDRIREGNDKKNKNKVCSNTILMKQEENKTISKILFIQVLANDRENNVESINYIKKICRER